MVDSFGNNRPAVLQETAQENGAAATAKMRKELARKAKTAQLSHYLKMGVKNACANIFIAAALAAVALSASDLDVKGMFNESSAHKSTQAATLELSPRPRPRPTR